MDRVLLVESGSRSFCERFLAHLYAEHPAKRVDVLTCYEGGPQNFDFQRGEILSIHRVKGSGRMAFLGKLKENNYSVLAIMCSNEDIMTRWKWAAVWKIPAKLLIVNENADYFWMDTANLGNLMVLIRRRSGLHSGPSLEMMLGVVAAPFVYLFLLSNAAWVYARRALRRL